MIQKYSKIFQNIPKWNIDIPKYSILEYSQKVFYNIFLQLPHLFIS
jgi:hypothetical protein